MGLTDGTAVGQAAHQRRVEIFVALLFGADELLFFKTEQKIEQRRVCPAACGRKLRGNLAPGGGAVARPEGCHDLFLTAGKLFHIDLPADGVVRNG